MPEPTTRRRRLPSLLLGAALAVLTTAGCAAAHGTTITPNTVDGVPTNLYLDGELLTTSDLPGWTASTDDSSGNDAHDTEPACFEAVDRIDQPTTSAEADFDKSGDVPEVDETLGAFPTGIQSTVAQIRATLGSCGHIAFTAGGMQFTGSVAATPISPIGNDTFAFAAPLEAHADGHVVPLGVVFAGAWKGKTLTVLFYMTSGAPDVASTAAILQQAEAKVS